MNPFRNIRNWKRKDWDAPKTDDEIKRRKHAEEEADHDLQKDVQQFLADVHEEVDHPLPDKPYENMTLAESRIFASLLKLAGVHKRTAALHTVTAHEAAVTSWWLKCLTWALAFLTILLVVLTSMLWRVASHTDEQINEIRQRTEKAWQAKEQAPGTGQEHEVRR